MINMHFKIIRNFLTYQAIFVHTQETSAYRTIQLTTVAPMNIMIYYGALQQTVMKSGSLESLMQEVCSAM